MDSTINRQIRLKSRPAGISAAAIIEYTEAPIPEPTESQVLARAW